MKKVYVPDISTIVNGRITQLIEEEELKDCKIILPNAILAELEHRAGLGKDSGFSGLAELKQLQKFVDQGIIELAFLGERVIPEQVGDDEFRKSIRDLVREKDATLITSNVVMAEIAEIESLKAMHLEPLHVEYKPKLFDYFTPDTMSVHLKERARPMAKRGRPGNFRIEILDEKPVERSELQNMSREITELAQRDPDGFIEIEREGASMVQFREYRIAIARPPFSDGMEITAVRPIVNVDLNDYELSDRLKSRLAQRAEGVLIAGPPGAGKSTFAQALAEFYQKGEKIVKTMESPRDLQVSDEVTQYTALEGEMEKTSELLLLVRPDYTIYDELRKTEDFEIFVDMRFAGVGMVGVVHSTRAIDAVQRLIGRVELGMIPMVVDTVIFIKDGQISEVFALRPTVGIPRGMGSPDMARPMVEICDFETDEPHYQIYSFGEQVVVMPVRKRELTSRERKKAKAVAKEVKRRTGADVDVEVLSEGDVIVWANSKDVPRIIGRGGKTVESIQREVGMRIDVRKRENKAPENVSEVEVQDEGKHLVIEFSKEYGGRKAGIYAGDSLLFEAPIGKNGDIRVKKDSKIGNQIARVSDYGVSLRAKIF